VTVKRSKVPFFSVVTPVYNTPQGVLDDMIGSVRAQSFPDWELILVDDCSTAEHVRPTLRRAAGRDSRIRVIERPRNGHIVAASNDGIDAAEGQFIALVDHDDLLTPDALDTMAQAIGSYPDVDYLYSDEDKLDEQGVFYDEFRKPQWSPERLRGQMYTGHLSVMRAAVVREVGGFRQGFDGSQDHDLALRVTERARRVVHVPQVLYHWRVVPGSAAGDADAKPYAWEAGRKAVQEHCDRLGLAAVVDFGRVRGTYRLTRTAPVTGLVSVVIPTRGGAGEVHGQQRVFVVEAVRSLLKRRGTARVEVVVVYDEPTPVAVLDELRGIAGDALTLVKYDKPFNYSEKCNLGACMAHGDVLLMLNDDIEVVSDDFVDQMVAPLREPGVGVTGARLLFEDGTLQHAGLVYRQGMPLHAYYAQPADSYGQFACLVVNRECSGLTGACIAFTRATWNRVGGFTETLPVNFNDVDFSLKIAAIGLRQVWLTDTTAYHYESKTRTAVVHSWEIEALHKRWGTDPTHDRYLPGL
jgi:GT2 family glycosyltransferase